MGKGEHKEDARSNGTKLYSWEEVNSHNKKDDKWIVIEDGVYDVTKWVYKHPGGRKILDHFAGHDATMAYRAFHLDLDLVQKYMRPLYVGSLRSEDKSTNAIDEDFEKVRAKAKEMGLFKIDPLYFFLYMAQIIAIEGLFKKDPLYFFLYLAHVIAIEVVSYAVLWFYGSGWLPLLLASFIHGTAQTMCGWLQHDFGHLSVMRNLKWDHFWQRVMIGFVKGASSTWWNNMHNQHHAKPNVMHKDPDVRIDPLFVVGDVMPKEIAKERKYSMPYNYQHRYFHFVTPLLFPLYFQVMIFRFCIIRKEWADMTWMVSFYVRFFLIYYPLMDSLFSLWLFYFLMRCVESMWFTWVAQSNHIPMIIDNDQNEEWVVAQMHGTCNVEGSWFNDWFTGHLNYQIEHHFFPTMPRNKLYKITPYVKELCEKHHLPFHVKTLYTSFADIVRTLRRSGNIWREAYAMYHDQNYGNLHHKH